MNVKERNEVKRARFNKDKEKQMMIKHAHTSNQWGTEDNKESKIDIQGKFIESKIDSFRFFVRIFDCWKTDEWL